MANKQTIFLRVRARELFPPDDPVVGCLLRLMAAVNDLRTLQLLWLQSSSREGSTQSEQEIIKAENVYLFRLTYATLYEAGKTFQEFRGALSDATRLVEIDRMSDEGRKAFRALENAFKEEFERDGWGKILVQLRNSAFHYAPPRVFLAELGKHDEFGNLIVGEIFGVNRYLLADDLQVQIEIRPLGIDFENNYRALAKTVAAFTGDLSMLVNDWVDLQLKLHEGSIVEKREDAVEMGRLWKIPERMI